MKAFLYCGLTALACGGLAGCGRGGAATDQQQTAAPSEAGEETETGYKYRAVEDLPAVGDYLAPLDDGKVEVAGPAGWIQLPNTSRHLAAFAQDKANQLPRITVTAAESPLPVLGDVTEDTIEQFVEIFDREFQRDAKKVVPEFGRPIYLGETLFVRHVRLAIISGKKVAIQSLKTVQGGRLYNIELYCAVPGIEQNDYVEPLTAVRDNGYAVAANMRFQTVEIAKTGSKAEQE
jgi:hypothetical protein